MRRHVRGIAVDTILMALPLITTREQIDEIMLVLHDTMADFEPRALDMAKGSP